MTFEPDQIFQRRIRRIQRILVVAIAVVAVAAVAACFVHIDETYKAYGNVVPRDDLEIFAPENSFVRKVHTREGERVTTGQLLLDLTTDDLDAEKLRLVNETERVEAEIASQQAQKELVLRKPLSAEFRHVGITLSTAQARVKHYSDYLKMLDQLAQEGIISKLEYSQAKLAQIQAQADLERDQADQKVLDKGYAEAIIREAQMQVRLLETARNALQRQRVHLEGQYAKRRIAAPAAGLVVYAEKRDPGEPVRQGELLVRLALTDAVMVRLRGPEHSVNRVSVGQPVRIDSLVFNPYKYGYAHGTVVRVAKEAEESSTGQTTTEPAAPPVYRILCSVTKLPEGQSLPLGSSVGAKITLRRNSLLFVLLGWGKNTD